MTEGFFPEVSASFFKYMNPEVAHAEQMRPVRFDKTPAEELTVVSGVLKREAQGEESWRTVLLSQLQLIPLVAEKVGTPC